MGRKKLSVEQIKKNITLKYGYSFLNDLDKLKTFKFGTLSSIGDKYGLSRERIRQIFKMLFQDSIINFHRNIIIEKESGACTHDPRRKNADYLQKNCSVFKGANSELIVFKKLKELGFNDISFGRSIDFKINGMLVEIKSSYKKIYTSKRATHGYFIYRISKKQRESAQFVIFYEAVNNRFFIFPNWYFKNRTVIYVPEPKNKRNKIYSEIKDFENNFMSFNSQPRLKPE